MSEPEADIIAKAISEWLDSEKENADIAGLTDEILNALDDAGFIIVHVGKPTLVVTEEALTFSRPDADDIVLPISGWIDLEQTKQ